MVGVDQVCYGEDVVDGVGGGGGMSPWVLFGT
jgi:hypothetical protein